MFTYQFERHNLANLNKDIKKGVDSMNDDESYGIISYREFTNLKKDIDDMKKKASPDTTKQIVDSMAKLSQGMDSMLQLFKSAADELQVEESSQDQFVKYLQPLTQKVDQLMEQTKIIAESMVGIVEMVKELREENEKHHAVHHVQHIKHHIAPVRHSSPMPPPMHQQENEQEEDNSTQSSVLMPPPNRAPPLPYPPQNIGPSPPPFGSSMPPPPMPQFGSQEDDLMDPLSGGLEPRKKGILGRFRK